MSEYLEYLFFSLLNRVARRLSYRTAGRVGAFLGGAVFRFTGFRKRVTLDNLSKALGSLPREELQRIARGAYRNYGIALLESLWFGNKSLEDLGKVVRVENAETMWEALAHQRGAIFLSGHYGGWEFTINSLRYFFDTPVATIVQRQRNDRIDALLDANRSRFGNITIPMGPSARHVIEALGEKKIVAMLGDQSGPKESVFIEFFGRPSATHRGAAAFCLKTGAPLVMGFFVRQHDGTYTLTFERIDLTGLDGYTEENIIELTKRHTAVLEKWIRRHPEHWLWMHKRWKHTPYYESLQDPGKGSS